MRKVTAYPFISLDAVTESPELWTFDHFDADLAELLAATTARADAVVMGRGVYDMWAGYWPGQTDDPFADFINGVDKYVFTSGTEPLEWANSIPVTGPLAERIGELRHGGDGELIVQGGGSLLRSLITAGLVDELTLLLHPVVAGKGQRLFPEGFPLTRFEARDTRLTRTGVTVLTLGRRD
ncbi:hypothetical protein Afil01_32180 [Actinorhabdospora filicis]|uniref:Bacterial bifunctional deaminase-reductase C-terminal domain-containing protein n=1 Tax=Actinorhabdospora filicis TaxID=1785913 RepID=A0A9W6WAB0_9ACTN|nr:dihydrofolate reductase family protein [Actinorhabdospora filicis]GLZ78411.1 hypothetical protein Afil01_32180 [Actinorhabdospora filicis]